MVTNTMILLYTNDDVPYMKNKEVEKIQFLCYDVTKWRHNVKILTDLESAHQGLSFEVLHDIVPSIWKFDLGVHHFWAEY